ncbi:DUF1801 domain-containing protein [Sphingomonas sp. AX6]|uniref:DUF1801 domain-containing protein n=1 Tax=Sphingomonas sp. AX6 TaxID=2653171 RepID=UPI0012EFFA7F|nr:DUF1801 domain-containing protein [Sphingomonas sp. AX6]VXC69787.1 conserved hypothetical protein [Sphingomonas sp. AX6]
MADNKTQPGTASVDAFIAAAQPLERSEDAKLVCAIMERLSGERAVMWGPSIIGFGSCHYRYDSGREGDMPRIGFSPRKTELVFYLSDEFPERADLMARLGKHRTGKSCLYVKRLSDIDLDVLEALILGSLKASDARYPR